MDHSEQLALELEHISLADAHEDVITSILERVDARHRFLCALVCTTWAKAVTASTRSIIVQHGVQDVDGLKKWLQKRGGQLEALQLHSTGSVLRPTLAGNLTTLPCPQLQQLLLHGTSSAAVRVDSSVWRDIGAATLLTSISVDEVHTPVLVEEVMSVLTALPSLQHIAWGRVLCWDPRLSRNSIWQREFELKPYIALETCADSVLMQQQLPQLTRLDLLHVTPSALKHLSSHTKLQELSIYTPAACVSPSCDVLGELQLLTRLQLNGGFVDIPPSITQLTALQQLDVLIATPTGLNALQELTALTEIRVRRLQGLSPLTTPLQLPALQHLDLSIDFSSVDLDTCFVAWSTQLTKLSLCNLTLKGPGRPLGSSLLQELVLDRCRLSSIAWPQAMQPWEQAFDTPGRLSHLTTLQLSSVAPALQAADIERVVACCPHLREWYLETSFHTVLGAVAGLKDLATLALSTLYDEQCSSLVQATQLRKLHVNAPWPLSMAGLRQLAGLEQLTCLRFGGPFDDRLVSKEVQGQLSDQCPNCRHAIVNKVRAVLRSAADCWCVLLVTVTMCSAAVAVANVPWFVAWQ